MENFTQKFALNLFKTWAHKWLLQLFAWQQVIWWQEAKLLFDSVEIQTRAINILQTMKTILRQAHLMEGAKILDKQIRKQYPWIVEQTHLSTCLRLSMTSWRISDSLSEDNYCIIVRVMFLSWINSDMDLFKSRCIIPLQGAISQLWFSKWA